MPNPNKKYSLKELTILIINRLYHLESNKFVSRLLQINKCHISDFHKQQHSAYLLYIYTKGIDTVGLLGIFTVDKK